MIVCIHLVINYAAIIYNANHLQLQHAPMVAFACLEAILIMMV